MKDTRIAIIGQGRSGRDIHGAFFKSESNEFFEVAYVVERILQDASWRSKSIPVARFLKITQSFSAKRI